MLRSRHPFRLLSAGAIALAMALCAGTRVIASTATATLNVSATVSAECTATDGTLAFGSYSPISGAAVDQSATFTVACTKGATATVGLDLGAHASAGVRRMADSGATKFLNYELYSDSGYTTVWGNSGGSLVSLSAAPSNAARTLTVYGRIPGGQDASVASYADAVTITVTF